MSLAYNLLIGKARLARGEFLHSAASCIWTLVRLRRMGHPGILLFVSPGPDHDEPSMAQGLLVVKKGHPHRICAAFDLLDG